MKEVFSVFNIAMAVLSILSVITVRFIIPILQEKGYATKMNNAFTIIDKAVKSAEQIYNQSGQGDLRKQYVIDFLKSKNIKMTDEELNTFIEASVLEMNNFKKELKAQPIVNVVNKEIVKPTE